VSAPRLLSCESLRVAYPGPDGGREALRGVDLELDAGEVVAVVGPSGAGKSSLALAVLGLLPPRARMSGVLRWRGEPVAPGPAHRRLLGRDIGMLFQDPLASLDPVVRVGDQLVETLRALRRAGRGDARRRSRELLAEVLLPDPAATERRYAHQLSGGERQRVALALALAGDPALLVADEPVTALDAAVGAAVAGLLGDLVRRRGMSLLLVTHDPRLTAGLADRVLRLESGRVAAGPAAGAHIGDADGSAVGAGPDADTVDGAPALSCRAVEVRYPGHGGRPGVTAVRGVDLMIGAGSSLALVGESGCGKTSLARAVCGHLRPAAGAIEVGGRPVRGRPHRAAQMIFQDPYSSLDPRQTCGDAVAEAARAAGGEAAGNTAAASRLAAVELLAAAGLEPGIAAQRPHALSGGQRQRVAVARALAARPVLLVADEPTGSLDPDAASLLIDVLRRFRGDTGCGLLLITHDVALARRTCREVAVMFAGCVLEVLPAGAVPRHPYTQSLSAGGAGALIPPALAGCPYAPRCPLAEGACRDALPDFRSLVPGHVSRCPVTAGNPETH
jgi:ABC-type glutathione transport system ATPase component